jgi:ankyrin repeat protein
MTYRIVKPLLSAFTLAGVLAAQTNQKVDFGKDVLPIFRQNCIGCHGPAQQNSGLRMDRKSSVFGRRGVVPGTSANSFVYHRVSGGEYGLQMPPTGPLRPEQISIIKTWIDQGAEWPDSLSNEAEVAPLNPKAVAMVEMLRTGDTRSFMKAVAEDPKLLNERGPGGSTPFMFAVHYTSKAMLEDLLKKGAEPNKRNDVNASALIWAAVDLEKTRLLLDHGADVNARSDDLRTPLMTASRRPGNSATVKLLLDRGANPNPNAHPATESSPLADAATAGDATSMELLLRKGADAKAAGQVALTSSLNVRCAKCVELLAAKDLEKAAYTGSLAETAVLGDVKAVRLMLDRGADPNAFDPLGRTPLMYAAVSDLAPLDVVKLLVERGADINAKDRHAKAGDTGMTVLDIAKMQGNTPVVQWLIKAGAKESERTAPVLKARQENTIQGAIQGSVPLLQRTDAAFMPKAACFSCHNNSLPAMAAAAARKRGFSVNEKISAQQVKGNVFGLQALREKMYQGFMFGAGDYFAPIVLSYVMVGLDAEHYPADLNTDAVAMYLKSHQMTDGQWPFPAVDTRPPLCSDYIGQTALAMRALQLYAPKVDKAEYDKSIRLAAAWMAKAQPRNNADRTWRVFGLAWAGNDKAATQKAVKELLAVQRGDGGWSDIETMESTAFATGKALVALQTAGVPVSDAAYERGVRYLLKTQQEDGSWYVRTRALAFQPYFDAEFPHGYDQWISSAGTSWATMALAEASPASSRPTSAAAQIK